MARSNSRHMKILIALMFVAAICCALLSHVQVLAATSMLPALLFAIALILALLHMINFGDRRY